MLAIHQVSEFRRDVKRLIRSGKDVSKLETIVTLLVRKRYCRLSIRIIP